MPHCVFEISYNNGNPALGVRWSWHRVESPSIEIPIQIWKNNVRWQIAPKLQKNIHAKLHIHSSGHFTSQAEPENKLKRKEFNGAMSTFF